MKKVLCLVIALFAISNSFVAQNSIAYQISDVNVSDHKLEMLSKNFIQDSEKSIMFQNTSSLALEVENIKNSNKGRGALIGGLIGGGLGFAVGLPLAFVCTLGEAIGGDNGGCAGVLVGSTLIGAGLGAGIGYAISK